MRACLHFQRRPVAVDEEYDNVIRLCGETAAAEIALKPWENKYGDDANDEDTNKKERNEVKRREKLYISQSFSFHFTDW